MYVGQRSAGAATSQHNGNGDEYALDGALTNMDSQRLTARSIGPDRPQRARRARLRVMLVALDAVAVALGWALGGILVGSSLPKRIWSDPAALAFLVTIVPVALMINHAFRLYRASSCSMQMLEISLLTRASAATAIVAMASAQALDLDVASRWVGLAAALSFGFLSLGRAVYRCRLAGLRKRGRFVRKIVIVGANDEAFDLWKLLEDNPEVGFRASGVVGDAQQYRAHPSWAPLLGSLDDTVELVRNAGATGVFIAATALSCRQLNALCRQLLLEGVHVQVASGLRGIDQRRMTPHPVAREPMFYLQAASLSKRQEMLKRAFDLGLGLIILAAALPVMAAAAVAIAVRDGRPVLFRQRRVGRHGNEFTIFKFRTMVRDAEARLIDLRSDNLREGPLFKMEHDPRVTRVGKFLRDTSLDELPQLFNVIRGNMSLVGPRPALPSETVTFDEDLLARHQVKPGITGLWQVHSRDDASFSSYQRLDLFYVENWSLAMDFAVLATTVPSVLWRGCQRLAASKAIRREASGVIEGAETIALSVSQVPSNSAM